MPTERPTITAEMVTRFAAYVAEHTTWGSLHIVLEEGNVEDVNVEHCIRWAEKDGDAEGAALGRILLTLTTSQRGRLDRRARMAAPPYERAR